MEYQIELHHLFIGEICSNQRSLKITPTVGEAMARESEL